MTQFADQFFGPNFPQAKCKDVTNKDMFYPDGERELEDSMRPLLEMCGGCIHETACLEFALEKNDLNGVWGGTTPSMRRRILRKKNLGTGKGMRITKKTEGRIAAVVRNKKVGLNNTEIGSLIGVDESEVRRILKMAKERKLI